MPYKLIFNILQVQRSQHRFKHKVQIRKFTAEKYEWKSLNNPPANKLTIQAICYQDRKIMMLDLLDIPKMTIDLSLSKL